MQCFVWPQVGAGWFLFLGALKIFQSFWMDLKQNSMFSSPAREPKCNYLHSCNHTSKETRLFLGSQVHGEGIPALMSSASMEMQDWPVPCCLVDGCSILTNRWYFTAGNSRYGYTVSSGNAARRVCVELKAKMKLHLPAQTPKPLPPNSSSEMGAAFILLAAVQKIMWKSMDFLKTKFSTERYLCEVFFFNDNLFFFKVIKLPAKLFFKTFFISGSQNVLLVFALKIWGTSLKTLGRPEKTTSALSAFRKKKKICLFLY